MRMKTEFFVYCISDLNESVKVTSPPNTRKTEDRTVRLFLGWVCNQISFDSNLDF